MIRDYANRRTAAPVRCVKDDAIGSISASLTPSVDVLQPDTQISLSYQASSYGSAAIESVTITAKYINTAGLRIAKTVGEELNIHKYQVEGVTTYKTPNDYNKDGIVFELVVRNEHGLVYTEELSLVELSCRAEFNRWVDTYNESVTNETRDFVVIGEEVRYYINISSNANPTSVTIDGKSATASGTFEGDAAFNTTWYITWSKDTKGVYDMKATIVAGGETFTDVDLGDEGKMTVYGLTISNNSTTTIDTSGGTLYVWQNSDYPSTYLTSVNTNLAANTSKNYYNLFTVEGQNIVSVARDQGLDGYGGTVSFATNGTNYNIAKFGNSINVSYEHSYWWGSTTTYYLRQSNTTTVQSSTTNSSRNWNVYTVTYDIP
jgi:hypothetical protein